MNETEKIVKILTDKERTIATMESCTGGGLANAITNVVGSSNVLKYSAVTYSDEYKIKMGVSKETIENFGIYSKEVATDMAKAISCFANSDFGIGITGKIEAEAYVCIYIKEQDKCLNCYLELKDSERENNKKEIIALIVSKLLDIL